MRAIFVLTIFASFASACPIHEDAGCTRNEECGPCGLCPEGKCVSMSCPGTLDAQIVDAEPVADAEAGTDAEDADADAGADAGDAMPADVDPGADIQPGWSLISPGGEAGPHPPIGDRFATTFDEARDVLLLQGGVLDPNGETWTFDGVDWSRTTTLRNQRRTDHAMAYHAASDTAVMFGGQVREHGDALADTRVFTGSEWAPHVRTSTPAARISTAMVYHPLMEKVLMFGGIACTYCFLCELQLSGRALDLGRRRLESTDCSKRPDRPLQRCIRLRPRPRTRDRVRRVHAGRRSDRHLDPRVALA
jgi:hypothetical protein